MAPHMSLQDLPVELIVYLGPFLGYFENLFLHQTCHRLHDVLPDINAKTATYNDLEASNSYPVSKGLWACYDCRTLRQPKNFTDAQRRGKRGHLGRELERRFCIDCGQEYRAHGSGYNITTGIRYKTGLTPLTIFGLLCHICARCRHVKPCFLYKPRDTRACAECTQTMMTEDQEWTEQRVFDKWLTRNAPIAPATLEWKRVDHSSPI